METSCFLVHGLNIFIENHIQFYQAGFSEDLFGGWYRHKGSSAK